MERIEEMKMLAKQEAENLKKFALKAELSRLSAGFFDANSQSLCIYGQLTGNCYSERAGQLILKCAPRVYSVDKEWGGLAEQDKLNGSPYETGNRATEYHTPIEVLILQDYDDEYGSSKYGERIINYLKGESDTLEL